ncbi:MAG: hypothetical protein LAN71_17060 [Acidobacteriia bacterium]|nr:hypothetical protein [Terriglobia bacterium]
MVEEILFLKEEVSYLKKDLEYTKDDLKRLTDEIKLNRAKIEELNNGTEKTITKIHVFRFGTIMGFMSALLGIVECIFILPLIGIIVMMPGIPPELKSILGGGFVLILLIVVILSFVMGFIFGMIEAAIYNLIASSVGGVKLTLVGETD